MFASQKIKWTQLKLLQVAKRPIETISTDTQIKEYKYTNTQIHKNRYTEQDQMNPIEIAAGSQAPDRNNSLLCTSYPRLHGLFS